MTLNIEFIYGVDESQFTGMESYYIYDLTANDTICDLNLNRSLIAIDRNNKLIYFLCMETHHHYILAKEYYFKIIQKFMSRLDYFDCEDYKVSEDCSGGEIYYKYLN
jgi:hypothetical protein